MKSWALRLYCRGVAAGQALPEYGLCIALITLACLSTLIFFGQTISNKLLCFAAMVAPGGSGGGGSC